MNLTGYPGRCPRSTFDPTISQLKSCRLSRAAVEMPASLGPGFESVPAHVVDLLPRQGRKVALFALPIVLELLLLRHVLSTYEQGHWNVCFSRGGGENNEVVQITVLEGQHHCRYPHMLEL
jgi:hypothetical protein